MIFDQDINIQSMTPKIVGFTGQTSKIQEQDYDQNTRIIKKGCKKTLFKQTIKWILLQVIIISQPYVHADNQTQYYLISKFSLKHKKLLLQVQKEYRPNSTFGCRQQDQPLF